MITKSVNSIVDGNVDVDSNFSIVASAHSFQILSSGLYKNKVEAIVRELSTNAYDSHKAAGREDKPFDVKLPSFNDATFYIRDYGTGLSDEDIRGVNGKGGIYTQYFGSTKTTSNDFVGCFGLGSKSPFCYVENFIVESWFEGVHRTYMVFISNGFPSISLVGEEKSDEPSGMKISLSARPDSYNSFQSAANEFVKAAQKVYSVFKVKPNIKGNQIVIPELPKPLISTDEFDIYSDRPLNHGSNNYVVMGQVIYPLDNNEHQRIVNCYYIIKAGIGDVEMKPDREGLQNTEKTKKYLEEVKNRIQDKINEHIENIVKTSTNYWEACKKYHESGFRVEGKNKPKFDGKELKSKIFVDGSIGTLYYAYLNRKDVLGFRPFADLDCATTDFKNFYTCKKGEIDHVSNRKKAKYAYESGRHIFVLQLTDDKSYEEFVKLIGFDPQLQDLSSLPKRPIDKNKVSYRGKLKKKGGYGNGYMIEVEYKGEEGYYFLTSDNRLEKPINIDLFTKMLELEGEKDSEIFYIGKTDRNRILKLVKDELEDGYEKYKELINKYKDSQDIKNIKSLSETLDNSLIQEVLKKIKDCKIVEEWKKIMKSLDKYKDVYPYLEGKIEKGDFKEEELFKKYPVLKKVVKNDYAGIVLEVLSSQGVKVSTSPN